MSSPMERPPSPPLLDENDRPGPPPLMSEEPRRSGRGLTVFIALFALLAFGGIVWYAYDQGLRTGSEESAPLIRADTSPVRVRPENPGGLQVPHQDKLIFEKLVGGSRTGERPVEQLLPRPEKPMPAPLPAVPPAVASVEKPKAPPSTGASAAIAPPPPPPLVVASKPVPAGIPPARIPSNTKAPRQLVPAPATIVNPAPAAKSVPVPKPAARPTKKAPAANPVAKAATKPAGRGVTPTQGGRFRIQIAAFKNEAVARSTWRRVQSAHKAQLGALTLTVERIQIADKGTFHRVQAGPLNETKARAVCKVLAARGQDCIVVRR